MTLQKINVKDIRPDRILKKIYQLAKFCKAHHSPLTFKYYLSLIYYFRLRIEKGFRHDEIFSLGLLSSPLSDENSNKYISQNEFKKILWTINGNLSRMGKWIIVSMNKGIFYAFCKNLNLPIPKMYAILFRDFLSVSYITNSSLLNNDKLIEFIKNELPEEFVIKPLLGEGGEFVNTYITGNDGIIDHLGNIKTERAIYESIKNNKKYDSFIVQERLKNHPYFLKISPSENLHTIRIITLVNSSNQCEILNGHISIATSQKIASQQGDLKINISLDDGILEYGIFSDHNEGGFKKITKHPETGRSFKEFKLPFWEDVISLSKEAALKFLPLRTLGWDIAITEKGPTLLETNTSYYPPNNFEQMDKFVKYLITS